MHCESGSLRSFDVVSAVESGPQRRVASVPVLSKASSAGCLSSTAPALPASRKNLAQAHRKHETGEGELRGSGNQYTVSKQRRTTALTSSLSKSMRSSLFSHAAVPFALLYEHITMRPLRQCTSRATEKGVRLTRTGASANSLSERSDVKLPSRRLVDDRVDDVVEGSSDVAGVGETLAKVLLLVCEGQQESEVSDRGSRCVKGAVIKNRERTAVEVLDKARHALLLEAVDSEAHSLASEVRLAAEPFPVPAAVDRPPHRTDDDGQRDLRANLRVLFANGQGPLRDKVAVPSCGGGDFGGELGAVASLAHAGRAVGEADALVDAGAGKREGNPGASAVRCVDREAAQVGEVDLRVGVSW